MTGFSKLLSINISQGSRWEIVCSAPLEKGRGGKKTVLFPRWSLNISFRSINSGVFSFQTVASQRATSKDRLLCVHKSRAPQISHPQFLLACTQHCWAQNNAPPAIQGHGSLLRPETLRPGSLYLWVCPGWRLFWKDSSLFLCSK